jgi:hypothetical protein
MEEFRGEALRDGVFYLRVKEMEKKGRESEGFSLQEKRRGGFDEDRN